MTVPAEVPVVEYTGNGVVTSFAWDWYMIDDSTINVIVDNENTTNWHLEGQNVVFDTAPEEGAEITIYRRTKIWQPSDYRAMGRFNPYKTELNMDRIIMITQERQGTSTDPTQPNGIVGGANLSVSRGAFDLTIVSERGTDAVLPTYSPDDAVPPPPGPPDPTILWGGADIIGGAYSLPGNTNGATASLRFWMDLTTGDPTKASASFPNYNAAVYVDWTSVDPNDGDYWMRVTELEPLPVGRYSIWDGNAARSPGEEFPMDSDTLNSLYGPRVTVSTFGDTAPSTRSIAVLVEICKATASGLPDGNWAGRNVYLEAIFNA